MIAARLFLSVTVCLIYVPHLTASFLRQKSASPKRFGKSSGAQRSNELPGSKIFFKVELPSESVATQFGSIVLECEAGGSPPPTIHWLKDGVRVLQDGSHRPNNDEASYEDSVSRRGLRLSSTRSRLYLDCLGEEDEGEYTCVAENAMLRKSQSTLLRVERPEDVLYTEVRECSGKRSNKGEPARIYMWTVSRLEFENSKVQLFCRAEGNPQPTITWYDRDNKPIESDDNYRITKSGDLIIRDITWLENMGGYTCVADNGFGTDTAQTFLYPTPRDDRFPL